MDGMDTITESEDEMASKVNTPLPAGDEQPDPSDQGDQNDQDTDNQPEGEVSVDDSEDAQEPATPSQASNQSLTPSGTPDTGAAGSTGTPTLSRAGSAKHPTQEGKAAFSRQTPGGIGEGVDNVLITELTGPEAEYRGGTDVLHVSDDEGVEAGEENVAQEEWDSAEELDTDLELDDEELYAELHDTTGRSKYMKTCEQLGVVPCSYFMRHILDPTIVMNYHGLGPAGTRAIAKVMKDNITVERLSLEGNWMAPEGARYMAKMLAENDYITEISLAGNRLGSEGAEHMALMLETNNTLKSIDLSGNFFEDKDAECLADAIENNKNLRELRLADNKFGSLAGEMLGPAISANDNLISLDLSWNQIRASGAKAVGVGLKENVRLKYCNLSWNGFGSEGGCAIIDALLVNATITELDVSGNRLDDECARHAAKVLSVNETLETLRIGRNPISTSGAVTIISALLKNEQTPLRELDMSEVPVEYEFVRIVEELAHRDVRVLHGPILRAGNTHDDIGKPAIDPHGRHPLLILKEHILVNDTRLVTALQKHDPDNTLCVTKDQFMQALDLLDIKYWRSQIDDVAKKLDKFRNGSIYYGDFIPPDGPKREPALGS